MLPTQGEKDSLLSRCGELSNEKDRVALMNKDYVDSAAVLEKNLLTKIELLEAEVHKLVHQRLAAAGKKISG